jgi:transposase
LTAKRFGASSEKTHNGQPSLFESLFNEAEATAESFAPEPELVTIVEHKRAKSKGKRGANLGGLPENIIEYHPPEDEMVCTCGHQRRVIGQEVSSELHYVSAQISVDVHVQNVYGCRCCGTWGW